MNSQLSILDDVKIHPIVQMIDNFERNHLLGLIYEFKVNESNILVCTSPLKDIKDSREAQWLQYSLIKYIKSDSFKPEKTIDIEMVIKKLTQLSILDDVKIHPIVQMIDNFERNHLLGLIYEFKVNESNILVCTSPLKDIKDSREAQWLQYSLIKYIKSDSFKPEKTIDIEMVIKKLM